MHLARIPHNYTRAARGHVYGYGNTSRATTYVLPCVYAAGPPSKATLHAEVAASVK